MEKRGAFIFSYTPCIIWLIVTSMYDTQPRHYHKSYKQKPQIYKMLIQEKEVPTMNWDLFV